ncbi:MAG TPA: DOMON-like domain-containing protein [Allosphingosinicella sp.]|jgi:hypothetical protein
MRLELKPHPVAAPLEVRRIIVAVGRDGDNLRISFRIPGDPTRLDLPERKDPRRADGLWERTCFECFIREPGSGPYHEYNFSPSTEWALYRFEAYRSGRTTADMPAPLLKVSRRADRFELSARIAAPPLATADWRVGISAIVVERYGNKSYWALAHPPGDPDFHDPACFALELPAARAA